MTAAPRIVGVDAARGLAVLGMFVAHAVPRGGAEELLVDGRSSILFATLAGVSLGLLTGAERPIPPGRRIDRTLSIVLRALILFLLGLVLLTLDSGVAIILDYYGIMFLLLAPLLFLPRWALGVLALVVALVAPRLAVAAEAADAGPIAAVGVDYLLTGYYPALVWLPYLLAGLIAARSDLRRPRTQVAMIAAGTALALLGYGAALVLPGVTAEAHSDSTAEVFGSGGVAIAVIGVLLRLTTGDGRPGRTARGVLWPVAAAGSMALTLYTMQIVTLAVFTVLRDDSGGAIEYPGWPLLIGIIVGALFFASAWRSAFGSGPLERLVTRLSRHQRRAGEETAPASVTPRMTTLGIIGAGNIGSQLARKAVQNGFTVVISNSRGPHTLADLIAELGPQSTAGTTLETAQAGDVVVVTIPLRNIGQVPPAPLAGKVVIDTNNYYPQRDGNIELLDTESTTVSRLLQDRLADSFVVKGFNHIPAPEITTDGTAPGTPGRRALAVAGDDDAAKAVLVDLYDRFGFDSVDIGTLDDSWRIERDQPGYGRRQSADELRSAIAGAVRDKNSR